MKPIKNNNKTLAKIKKNYKKIEKSASGVFRKNTKLKIVKIKILYIYKGREQRS